MTKSRNDGIGIPEPYRQIASGLFQIRLFRDAAYPGTGTTVIPVGSKNGDIHSEP
jgi:hypothetical protein